MSSMSAILQAAELKNSASVPRELLEDLLIEFAKSNQERIASAEALDYTWSTDVVEFIFNLCGEWDLKKHVKYRALEIFEHFIADHVVETYRSHLDILKRKESNWANVEKRLSEQSVLRVLTAIQLASKLESHYEHVIPKQVSEVSDKCGKPFSLDGIFNSELRMMKTLKYRVHSKTPAEYLELLLYVLFKNDPGIEEEMYETALTVLDFVYLHRAAIYGTLYENITGKVSDEEANSNEAFVKIKADYMLLATAIIAGIVYVFFNDRYKVVLEQLHLVTRIVNKDIRDFSAVIAYLVSEEMAD